MTQALKLPADGKENLHTMSVLIDMKRRSPTVVHRREIVDFSSAGTFCELLTKVNADAFLINTDELEYGGKWSDLKESVQGAKRAKPHNPPSCILKDIIIHPIQVD